METAPVRRGKSNCILFRGQCLDILCQACLALLPGTVRQGRSTCVLVNRRCSEPSGVCQSCQALPPGPPGSAGYAGCSVRKLGMTEQPSLHMREGAGFNNCIYRPLAHAGDF